MRELVLVAGGAGNGCRFRGYGFNEGVGRRGLAAVMADFEDVRFEVSWFIVLEDLFFDFFLGIASKHHRELAIGHLADDGIVIGQAAFRNALGIFFSERRARRQDGKGDVIAQGEGIALFQGLIGNVLGLDVLQVIAVHGRIGTLAIVIDLLDFEVLEQFRHAAQVVAVGMSDDDDVDILDLAFFELFDQIGPAVDFACIDEHILAFILDERRIGLTDVEDGYAQVLVRGTQGLDGLGPARRAGRRAVATAGQDEHEAHDQGQGGGKEFSFFQFIFLQSRAAAKWAGPNLLLKKPGRREGHRLFPWA